MKRKMLTIVTVIALALLIHGGFAPRLLAQALPPPPGNPPPMPGAGMTRNPGMGGPGMMGQPNFPHDLMANRYRHMHEMEEHGCGGMGPEMGIGPGMGMGMGMMGLSDAKSQAQMMQLRGKTMQMWGEWMEKRGKELEQQAK
jgi:hypothetical protein